MTEFGKTLREAREQKGLTVAQIAEQTHLLPQIVEDLENEDFHRISAPIYGRGFVKLYCEAVGLDAKPLVDEFMAILNGEREPAIRLREVELPREEIPAEEPAAPAEPPQPVFVQPDLEPSAAPPLPAPTADVGIDPENRQYHPDYARTSSTVGPTVNFGRLAILAGGAIILLMLLITGGRALYRATMTVPGEESKSKVEVEGRSGEKSKPKNVDAASSPRPMETKPAVKREPKDVPPLYID